MRLANGHDIKVSADPIFGGSTVLWIDGARGGQIVFERMTKAQAIELAERLLTGHGMTIAQQPDTGEES